MAWKGLILLICVFVSAYGAPPKYDEDKLLCEFCHIAINDLKNLINQNATQETVKNQLDDICSRLAVKDVVSVCLGFVKNNSAKIFNTISNGMDPESVCQMLNVCPTKLEEYEYVEPEEPEKEEEQVGSYEGDEEEDKDQEADCEVCRLLVAELDSLIDKEKKMDEISETLQKLCVALPDSIKNICEKHSNEIVEAIVRGVNPGMICKTIDVCMEEKKMQKTEKQSERVVSEIEATPVECSICKLIVTELDQYVEKNASKATINATLYKVCNKLPTALKTFCIAYAPQIVENLEKGLSPASTCVKVKMCDSNMTETDLNLNAKIDLEANPLFCEACKILVGELEKYLVTNSTEEKVNQTLLKVCDSLPAELKTFCKTYEGDLVKAILEGITGDKICEYLKVCPAETLLDLPEEISDEKIEMEIEEYEVKDAKCDLCKYIINVIDGKLADNSSTELINNTVYSLCALLPSAVKVTCDLIAPTIVKEVDGGFDPERACEAVSLCTNSSQGGYPVEIDEVIDQHENEDEEIDYPTVKGAAECEVCQLVVQILDKYLAGNKTDSEVNATVYKVCGLLPDTIKVLCDTIAPNIVSIIIQGADPKEVCTKLNICGNDTLPYLREIHGLSCGMCHGIVEVIAKDKYDPETANAICHIPCPHSRRRRSVRHLKKTVKKSVGQKKRKITLNEDWDCDVCTWLAEAATIFMEDNATEETISRNLYSACGFLPDPYSQACRNTVPIIVKELEHGLEAKKFCKEVMPDDCYNYTRKAKMPENLLRGIALIRSSSFLSSECTTCKTFMGLVFDGVDKSEESIQAYVDGICKRFPSPTAGACELFADKEFAAIKDKIIDKVLDPTTICELLNICE